MLNRALRLLRSYHQLSQQFLAERLNISGSYLSEIEKGKKAPSMELLERYSEIFKMPVSSIMLFAEAMGGKKNIEERVRVGAADKILKLLEWIEDRDAIA